MSIWGLITAHRWVIQPWIQPEQPHHPESSRLVIRCFQIEIRSYPGRPLHDYFLSTHHMHGSVTAANGSCHIHPHSISRHPAFSVILLPPIHHQLTGADDVVAEEKPREKGLAGIWQYSDRYPQYRRPSIGARKERLAWIKIRIRKQ